MTREELITKVKDYCDHELEGVDKFGKFGCDPDAALVRCYGAVMFVISSFDAYEELGAWWNDEMHPKFRERGAF